MNREEEILNNYLNILCNDFVVERKPRLSYIPYERKVGIVGLYDAKIETIILYTSDYRSLIHEFIHHLQYEECGYDYKEYMKRMKTERYKPYFKREYEIEAQKLEAELSDIYKETFERGINAKPIGNDKLAEELVGTIITKFTVTIQMLEEAIDYTTATIVTEDFTRLPEVFALSAIAYTQYESMLYLLKYVARAYFLKWNIPELQDLNKEIREIMERLDLCKDIANSYYKYPFTIKHARIHELSELYSLLSDTMLLCDKVKMHFLDVFSKPTEESLL
jgi:hypothetical protein